jgi:hypothetical protein
MMMGFAGLMLASHLVMPVADRIPDFNVEQTCKGVQTQVNQGRDRKGCLQDERTARDSLRKDWGSFQASDRSRCSNLASLGGLPSYVELLTCLQIAKEARNLPPTSTAKELGHAK